MNYIGIDPGQDGAIAVINEKAEVITYEKYALWNTWKAAQLFIAKHFDNIPTSNLICIEKLWGMPIRGSLGNFGLGLNYGGWKAVLEIHGMPYTEISPATWQPRILNTSKKKSEETKPLSLAYVNRRFPHLQLEYKKAKDIKNNSGISDAICLALYAKYIHTNTI